MSDPVLEAARKLVGDALSELHESLDGLSVEALNWRPAPDGNSIAAMATHALLATRLWLNMAVGRKLPDRDRDAEFRAMPEDAAEFRSWASSVSSECIEALASKNAVNWATSRKTRGRGGDAPPEVPAAYALIHATEHLRGHVDQVSLMRALWESPA
jgi:uncharacterized damage-inducible protein DinB